MNQPELFDEGPVERAFHAFHAGNPAVYRELVHLAKTAVFAGRRRYGIKALFEIVRWNRALVTRGDDFKINNNFAPYYARLIMERERDLAGFFETRRMTGE